MTLNGLLLALKHDLELVYEGEEYGEHIALDFIRFVSMVEPYYNEKMFSLIKKYMGVFHTKNLDDYFQYIYSQGETIVDLYSFESNNESEQLIRALIKMFESEEA